MASTRTEPCASFLRKSASRTASKGTRTSTSSGEPSSSLTSPGRTTRSRPSTFARFRYGATARFRSQTALPRHTRKLPTSRTTVTAAAAMNGLMAASGTSCLGRTFRASSVACSARA